MTWTMTQHSRGNSNLFRAQRRRAVLYNSQMTRQIDVLPKTSQKKGWCQKVVMFRTQFLRNVWYRPSQSIARGCRPGRSCVGLAHNRSKVRGQNAAPPSVRPHFGCGEQTRDAGPDFFGRHPHFPRQRRIPETRKRGDAPLLAPPPADAQHTTQREQRDREGREGRRGIARVSLIRGGICSFRERCPHYCP